MNTKKVLALVLTAVLATSTLVGCGSKKEDSAKDATTASKITVVCWNAPNADPAKDIFTQAEKALGIEIEVTVIPETEYSSKLNQMVSTKDTSSDIYIIWENDIANFAEVGGIVPMDDYLAKSTIKTDEFIGAVSSLADGLGGTYGLPWCAATEILYYNQDMFDAAGVAYPTNDWSYADYLAAAEKLTIKAEDGSTQVYGATLPNLQTWWAGVGGAGDKVYDPSNGQLVIGDGAVSFVTDCADMVANGIMPEPSSDTADLFGAGQAAMSWQGSWAIGGYSTNLTFNWDIATIPTNEIKYNTLHTGFYSINASSPNQDTAFKVIEYLMGEEAQNINSNASGNPSAITSIANQGAWKVAAATTVENWDAITDSLAAGIFGYTCLPSGVTGNAISEFNSALLGQKTPQEAVDSASAYAKETIGY